MILCTCNFKILKQHPCVPFHCCDSSAMGTGLYLLLLFPDFERISFFLALFVIVRTVSHYFSNEHSFLVHISHSLVCLKI